MSRQTDPHYPQIAQPIASDQHVRDVLTCAKQRIDKHSSMIEALQTALATANAQIAALQKKVG